MGSVAKTLLKNIAKITRANMYCSLFLEDIDVDETPRAFIGMRILYPFLELIKYSGEKDNKLSVITQDLFSVVQSRYVEVRKYSAFAT